MSVTYTNRNRSKCRITLELDVHDDFNPRQIDWEKMFELQEDESVVSYIEEEKYADSW